MPRREQVVLARSAASGYASTHKSVRGIHASDAKCARLLKRPTDPTVARAPISGSTRPRDIAEATSHKRRST